MLTVRQIERLNAAKDFGRLLHDLTSHRVDALVRWDAQADRRVLAAAMSAIRLDELNQAHHVYTGKVIQTVLASQDVDGGWGDPLTTALCLRALLASKGAGQAVQRGLTYLASVQQESGAFPAGPLRRMPADSHVTAAILFFLSEFPAFWTSLPADAAARWLDRNLEGLDDATRVVWRHGSLRCRRRLPAESVTAPAARWAKVA